MDHGGVVAVRRDGDVLDTAIVEPERQPARQLPAPCRGVGLEVTAPVEHGVAILRNILGRAGGKRVLPDGVHAPSVLRAPVPALPRIRVARLHGVAPAQIQQAGLAPMRAMNRLALAMAVGLAEDRVGPVLLMHPLDLGSYETACLVPAYALVLAHPAVLGIALALGIPIDALHGERNAVARVGAALVRQREVRRRGLHARLEGRAVAARELPVVELLFGVVLVEAHRADAHDLAVEHIGSHHVGATAAGFEP